MFGDQSVAKCESRLDLIHHDSAGAIESIGGRPMRVAAAIVGGDIGEREREPFRTLRQHTPHVARGIAFQRTERGIAEDDIVGVAPRHRVGIELLEGPVKVRDDLGVRMAIVHCVCLPFGLGLFIESWARRVFTTKRAKSMVCEGGLYLALANRSSLGCGSPTFCSATSALCAAGAFTFASIAPISMESSLTPSISRLIGRSAIFPMLISVPVERASIHREVGILLTSERMQRFPSGAACRSMRASRYLKLRTCRLLT